MVSEPFTDREQRICHLLVSCAMMIHDEKIREAHFKDKDFNEIGDWIREQLSECGIQSVAMGAEHVYLTKEGYKDTPNKWQIIEAGRPE